MTGGPTCKFNDVEIPCFVCVSPNASITSELLAQMLKQIDSFNLFPRSEELGVPFLLVDGHHSRTRLLFLEYITNKEHQWKVCIGVPYGTHIWQPADSSELNGTFKMKLYVEKLKYLKKKQNMSNNYSFSTTDIIPIINRIWNNTLGDKQKAKKAIAH